MKWHCARLSRSFHLVCENGSCMYVCMPYAVAASLSNLAAINLPGGSYSSRHCFHNLERRACRFIACCRAEYIHILRIYIYYIYTSRVHFVSLTFSCTARRRRNSTGARLLLRGGRGRGDVRGEPRALLEEGGPLPRQEEGGVRAQGHRADAAVLFQPQGEGVRVLGCVTGET